MVSRNLCPVFGTIQVLGKENIQPNFLEVRLAEVKKKQKITGETAVLIKAVYEMIDIGRYHQSHRWKLQLQSLSWD